MGYCNPEWTFKTQIFLSTSLQRRQDTNEQVSTCTLAAYHKHILKMLQVKEPLPVSQNFDEPASKKCKTDKIHVEIKTELASDKSSVIILQLSIH